MGDSRRRGRPVGRRSGRGQASLATAEDLVHVGVTARYVLQLCIKTSRDPQVANNFGAATHSVWLHHLRSPAMDMACGGWAEGKGARVVNVPSATLW